MKKARYAGMVLGLTLALGLRGDAVFAARRTTIAHAVPHGAPPITLWAWEEPEDLRTLDSSTAGVAFLAEQISLGASLAVTPRRQRILVPPGVWAEAVVRIETRPGFTDTDSLRAATAQQLLHAAALPGIRGLQVDFDATRSQRAFYADVLRRTRAALPPGTSLSMTALVSWCAVQGGWMRSLPVDAAVPMYFRLGKQIGTWGLEEPLCMGAAGVSTDELQTRPRTAPGRRTYLFAPRPWTLEQLALVNRGQTPASAKGGR